MKFLHLNVEEQMKGLSLRLRRKFRSRTVAVVPPKADEVLNIAVQYLNNPNGVTIPLNIGVTFLSLEDRYVKETGRQEATKKMQIAYFDVKGVSINDGYISIHLQDYLGIHLDIRSNRKTKFTTVVGHLTSRSV